MSREELERFLTDEGRAKIDRLFTEDDMDEPVEDVLAAFERGVKGVTTDPDDGITCNCHPVKGWAGKPPVALDGNTWPVDFAAKMIGCSEKDLRDLIRITGLEPAGTLKMASYRRSGRNPRAYDASKLIKLWQGIQDLAKDLHE
jgi:hypothetical protein